MAYEIVKDQICENQWRLMAPWEMVNEDTNLGFHFSQLVREKESGEFRDYLCLGFVVNLPWCTDIFRGKYLAFKLLNTGQVAEIRMEYFNFADAAAEIVKSSDLKPGWWIKEIIKDGDK